MILTARSPRHLLVADLGIQLGGARPQDSAHDPLGIELVGLELPQAHGELDLIWIPMGGGDVLAIEVLVEQVHGAPICQRRNSEVGDVPKRLLVVERGDQHPAGFSQHPRSQLGGLDRCHILDHGHRGEELAAGVAQRRGLKQLPLHVTGGAANSVQQQRARHLATQQPHRRQVLHRQWPAIFVGDDVVLHDRTRRAAAQFIERLEPHRLARSAIGVDDRVVRGPGW